MNKLRSLTFVALVALTFALVPGCASLSPDAPLTEGDIALISQDLRDIAHAGTVYALAENPEWRANIGLVRDQLLTASTQDHVTFDTLLLTLQGLPIKELKTNEALLAITAGRITLRRIGRNVELGNVANLKPIAKGLADGITDGLNAVVQP